MYRYFLGEKSNFFSRKDDMPIVIGTDIETREKLEKWLDFYRIDIDVLADHVKQITDLEILNIVIMGEDNTFAMEMENKDISYLEFDSQNSNEPRFKLEFEDFEYEGIMDYENFMLSYQTFFKKFSIRVTALPLSQRLQIKERSGKFEITIDVSEFSVDMLKIASDLLEANALDSTYKIMEIIYPILEDKTTGFSLLVENNNDENPWKERFEVFGKDIITYVLKIDSIYYWIDFIEEKCFILHKVYVSGGVGEKDIQYDLVKNAKDIFEEMLYVVTKIKKEIILLDD